MIERVEVLQDGASAIWFGRHCRCGQHHHQKSQKGLNAVAQLGGYDDGDGFSQNYQISWGNGDDGPLQFVVGGNYVKQSSISSADRDISLFPAPYATSCLEGGCSSGTPLGRFIVFPSGRREEDLTLIQSAPAREITPTPADYRTWAGNADRFNFAPYNFIQTPLRRYGVFANP
jgi:iron complex outermembrane receptor protein